MAETTARRLILRQGLTYAPDNPALRHELGTAFTCPAMPRALSTNSPRSHADLGICQGALQPRHAARVARAAGDAVERFAAAVEGRPDYPAAEFQLAEALRRTGRTAESLSHYTHVIKADPKTAEVRIGYAMALGRLGRYLEARRALTDAMQAIPDQPSLGQAFARVLAAAPDDNVRDGGQAMAITQSLMKQPHGVDLYETMAMTLAELGQYDQAVQWQRGAIAAAMKEGHAELGDAMAANLRLYESHMPCRTPWRNDQ